MKQEVIDQIRQSITGFRFPRYDAIPADGLYLEQTAKYITDILAPLSDDEITGSMISNSVKRGLLSNPVRKQYNREQIAYLLFAMCVKKALSMDNIKLMMSIQKQTYPPERAYNYFCNEFENILEYVFGLKSSVEIVGTEHTYEKVMLRNAIITAAHKIYLDKLFAALQAGEPEIPQP